MILVFILLAVIILILLVLCMILASTLRIQIKNLQMSNMLVKKQKSYKIFISLYLWNKVKWLSICLDEYKMKKMINKMTLQNIDLKKVEQNLKIEELKVLKKLNIKLSTLSLNATLGTKSPISTAFIVAFISSIISIILPHIIKNAESKQYKYVIKPIYENKNIYKISLNCIIELKMVHIINVIYIFYVRKGKSDENERTTSNRKSYGYSYE